MILRIYAIRDIKAVAFAPPFFYQRDEVALRAFADAMGDPSSPLSRHPGDYQLYHLGEFDDESGVVSGIPPRFVANGNGEIGQES